MWRRGGDASGRGGGHRPGREAKRRAVEHARRPEDQARAPPQSLLSVSPEEEADPATTPMESQSQVVGLDAWTAWRRGISIQSTDSVDPDSLAICMEDIVI